MKLMKRLTAFLVFYYANSFAFGQTSLFFTNFDSTALPSTVTWFCDTSKFVVVDGELATFSDDVNDEFGLSFRNLTRKETEWSVDVHLPFATSSSNYVDVCLWADSSCLTAAQNAYFVRIGDTKDQLVLYEMIQGVTTQLAASTAGITHSISGQLITRLDAHNMFSMAFNQGDENVNLWTDTVTISGLSSPGFCGLFVKQSTTSFHKKHRFDNWYYGPIRRDSVPPSIVDVRVSSSNVVLVQLSEEVDRRSLRKDGFRLKNTVNPVTKISSEKDTVFLVFKENFHTGEYMLEVDSLIDLEGNVMRMLSYPFEFVKVEEAERHDVLLTEIMADYSPSVGLPPSEYLELTNRSDKIIDLKHWQLTDRKTVSALNSYYLYPDSIVLLVDENDASLFQHVSNVLPVKNLISLNNASDSLQLLNAQGSLINEVNYSVDWHQYEWKQPGGWSLELMDVNQPCLERSNWTSSVADEGGTPGTPNSVRTTLVDNTPPVIMGWEYTHQTLLLTFNEVINHNQPKEGDITVRNNDVVSIDIIGLYSISVRLGEAFVEGQSYEVSVKNFMDCMGNRMEEQQIKVGVGGELTRQSLLINELLYDVSEHCAEFVELYNPSSTTYDLNSVFIGMLDTNGNWKQLERVSDQNRLLEPYTYCVLTKDTNALKQCKTNAQNMVETINLPDLSNAGGIIGIGTQQGRVIDSLQYLDDMHFKLFSDTRDVSLERMLLDTGVSPWTSAAASVNYATPGMANSQLQTKVFPDTYIVTDPVSPNDDGVNDRLLVQVENAVQGSLVYVRIFNQFGHLVAFPVNAAHAGTNDVFQWDCVDEHGILIPEGIYILLLETISTNGYRDKVKLPFTVIR